MRVVAQEQKLSNYVTKSEMHGRGEYNQAAGEGGVGAARSKQSSPL